MSDSLAQEINQQITLLTPVQQQDVLSFIRSIHASTTTPSKTPSKGKSSKGTRGKDLLKFVGSISPEDLELMESAIKEGCEQVDSDGW